MISISASWNTEVVRSKGFPASIIAMYWESFDDVLKAISREKQLKGWRRSKKIALIEFTNPRWEDLAEKWGAEMSFAGEPITGR